MPAGNLSFTGKSSLMAASSDLFEIKAYLICLFSLVDALKNVLPTESIRDFVRNCCVEITYVACFGIHCGFSLRNNCEQLGVSGDERLCQHVVGFIIAMRITANYWLNRPLVKDGTISPNTPCLATAYSSKFAKTI